MTDFKIVRNASTEALFDAAAQGQLLIRKDADSDQLYPPHQRKGWDGAEVEWVPASGKATLISWAVDYGDPVSPELLSASGEGSVIAMVELAEGPWMHAALPGVDPAALNAGMDLTVAFLALGGGEAVPVFQPASDSAAAA